MNRDLNLDSLKGFNAGSFKMVPIFIMTLFCKKLIYIKLDNAFFKLLFMVLTFVSSIGLPIFFSKILMKVNDKFKYIGLVK